MAPFSYVEVESAGVVGGAKSHGGGGAGGAPGGAGHHRAAAWLRTPAARRTLWTGVMIASWYALSTALGMFNKIVVGRDHGLGERGAFPAPLLMSATQFAFQAVLAKLVFASGLMARTAPPLGVREWSRLVLPNGAITGLDIGLSNKSLVHITMSFYTMCKSTTPIFLLLFAFIWGLEQPSCALLGVVSIIVAGLLLLVKGEARFDATGFALVMTASCMSGLRFTLTQVLLHGGGGGSGTGGSGSGSGSGHQSPFGGPLEVLEALTPVMSATTLLLSLVTERLWDVLPDSPYFEDLGAVGLTIGIIFAGALIAFAMVWCEYEVIRETSALTFMIAGVVKEIITIIAAVAVFGDHFGWLNGLGLAVAIFGVALFNLYKLRRLRAAIEPQEVPITASAASVTAAGTARRTVSAGGGGDFGGGGDHPGDGKGGDAAAVVHHAGAAAALVPRAASAGAHRGAHHAPTTLVSAGSGWRRDGGGGGSGGGGGGAHERRRNSASLSASGSADDAELGVLEHEPLLLGGGNSSAR